MGLIQDIAALAPANSQHPPAPRTRTHTFGLRIPGVSPSTNGNHRLDVPRYGHPTTPHRRDRSQGSTGVRGHLATRKAIDEYGRRLHLCPRCPSPDDVIARAAEVRAGWKWRSDDQHAGCG